MAKDDVEDIKKALRKKPPAPGIRLEDMVSTGSTLLNLACSGRSGGGLIKGKYYYIWGDTTSGKTWLTLTCFAEAMLSPEFKDYRLIFDNVEDGALMDMAAFFGARVAERMRAPAYDKDKQPIYSTTVESFYYNLDTCFAKSRQHRKPFIYVLDSQDSLTSKASNAKFAKQKKAFEEEEEAAGSMGDNKAKVHSENIRRVVADLRDTGSILIIIGQSRDNLGMSFETRTRSGGRSLPFYATVEMVSSVRKRIVKKVKGTDIDIGAIAQVFVKKNRITGKRRTVYIPFYHAFGIDNTGANVDYLVETKLWDKPPKQELIHAEEFDVKLDRESLIKHIEDNGLEKDLADLVAEMWREIEDACEIERKPRYT